MDFGSVIWDAVRFIGGGLLVLGAYAYGHHMAATYENRLQNILVVIGSVLVVTLVLWSSYGTHVEDADPVFGGGDTVTDFEPTDKERNEYGLKALLILGIPATYGLFIRLSQSDRVAH